MPNKDPEKRRAYMLEYKARNFNKLLAYKQDWDRTVKQEAMNAYGGSCVCCGESNLIFLTLHHINNDGAEHRRKFARSRGGVYFYYWLKTQGWPEGYQTLCFNCNWARQFGK